MDIVGPIKPEGVNGESYAQKLADDYGGATSISTKAARSEVGEAKKMLLHAQKLSAKMVGNMRPDNAKELKMGRAKKFFNYNRTMIDNMTQYSS